jgi:hypothetical protein
VERLVRNSFGGFMKENKWPLWKLILFSIVWTVFNIAIIPILIFLTAINWLTDGKYDETLKDVWSKRSK